MQTEDVLEHAADGEGRVSKETQRHVEEHRAEKPAAALQQQQDRARSGNGSGGLLSRRGARVGDGDAPSAPQTHDDPRKSVHEGNDSGGEKEGQRPTGKDFVHNLPEDNAHEGHRGGDDHSLVVAQRVADVAKEKNSDDGAVEPARSDEGVPRIIQLVLTPSFLHHVAAQALQNAENDGRGTEKKPVRRSAQCRDDSARRQHLHLVHRLLASISFGGLQQHSCYQKGPNSAFCFFPVLSN